jgi:allantoinase
MSDFDLIVRGRDRDLGVSDGKFSAIGRNLRGYAKEEIDATGLSIFPGVIDSHVHFNEPGRTNWEGFKTGSRAAAAGGTTTVFDMPLNAHPPTIDGSAFDQKRAAAEGTCLIDFGLWGGLVPGNLGELQTLRDRGVVGLKAFMCNSGIDDFAAVTVPVLREGMKRAAELGLLMAVHAESEEMTASLTLEKISAGRSTIADYLESRPLEAELEAIGVAIDLARETGCRLHIVHVSSGFGVGLVNNARADAVDVTCETCPHYLFFLNSALHEFGATAKCAPPLRTFLDQRDLWNRLDQVTTIGSDHSPSPPEMKRGKDFFRIWGGISGCQHLLPLLADSEMPVHDIHRLTSVNVAGRFRMTEKGGLVVGRDADFSIVDMNARDEVTTKSLRYRHRQSPYVGRTLGSRVVRTVLRGQTIYRDGKLVARPIGKLVRPVQTAAIF